MASKQQTRDHAGHSHEYQENAYLTSTNKNDAGVRITRIGLYVNLSMAISKSLGGYVFNSQALLADGIHSLTDLVSDILTLATVSWSLKPPTERFPSGYGKIESLGSLGVSGVLLGGGFLMGYSALLALLNQFFPDIAHTLASLGLVADHGHSHSHSHSPADMDLGPSLNAAWLAGGSIVIKEWLYRATMRIAREKKSSVLASNAYHHRVDSLTAFVALLLIVGSRFMENASWLDPVGGLVISLMVVQAGWGNTKEALYELADAGIDDKMRDSVWKQASKALTTDLGPQTARDVVIKRVQGVKSGQNYLMDIVVEVSGKMSIRDTEEIESAVRTRVGAKVRGVKRVRMRFVATEASESFMDEFIPPDVSPRSSPEPESEDEHKHDDGHDHKHDHDPEKKH